MYSCCSNTTITASDSGKDIFERERAERLTETGETEGSSGLRLVQFSADYSGASWKQNQSFQNTFRSPTMNQTISEHKCVDELSESILPV